jgi:hypothetical protein
MVTTSKRSQPDASPAADIGKWLGHITWQYRVELCPIALAVALYLWLDRSLGPIAAGVLVGMVAASVLTPPPLRRLLARVLHRSRVRRQLTRAFAALSGRIAQRSPVIGKVRRSNGGDTVACRLRPGTSWGDLASSTDLLAVALGVMDVRVAPNRSKSHLVTLTIVRQDPFDIATSLFPLLHAESFDAWDAIPVGVDEEGTVVPLSLPEHNVLFGAEPGGGKSAALSVLVAALALDPTVDLWLFDGKLVELAPWRASARSFVGPDVERAIDALEVVRAEMDARYEALLARGVRKVGRGDGMALQVVVIDELALYVSGVDKKVAMRFTDLLRDLVARGRAAGVIVLAATQKPSTEIIPSSLRDLFGFRWALRCSTRESSDTVLGSGWAAQGCSAADIDPALRGVGLLLHEGGRPVRLRSFHLEDDELAMIADRAARLRTAHRGTPGELGP